MAEERMPASLLQWLCCPFCGGCLQSEYANADGFGILGCRCGRYPVVAGIPVIKRGAIGSSGATADEVTRLIEEGRLQETLNAMLMPPAPRPPQLAPAWMQSLAGVRGIRRLPYGAHERAAPRWRERMGAVFNASEKRPTVSELLDLYYRRSGYGWNDAYDYFTLRFGQPRHLVALSFATLIQNPDKPVLDLACGFGHITRTLLLRAGVQPVVGVDETFFGLYVAKQFIAPEAGYVCCVGDAALPFRDGTFSVAFCSDAFHYFVNKVTAARELKRLTLDEGTIITAWMHNRHFRVPHDGLPLPPESYEALVADLPHRIVADSEVLTRYLRREGPPLARSLSSDRLSAEPLVSIVASRRTELFRDYGVFAEWPHAEGRLDINPLYALESHGSNGDIRLRRAFPSDYYRREHAESAEYLPEAVTTDTQTLTDVAKGNRTADVERLVEQFVVLGMPTHYK
jgi:ubiquinone/menaquinone biosynthesis C-methylase UbiE